MSPGGEDPGQHPAPRADIRRLVDAALRGADAGAAIERFFERPDTATASLLDRIATGKVVPTVLALGKVAGVMAGNVAGAMPGRVGGIAVTKDGYPEADDAIETIRGDHPLPGERSLAAGRRVMDLARRVGTGELLVVLLSGGASALLEQPAGELTIAELNATNRLLLECGAGIVEINVVRKHLSALKGGRLAAIAHPARVWTLAVSDVVGNDISSIGSGPTVSDPTTYADALAVLVRHSVTRVPESVLEHLKAGAAGTLPETPKPGDAQLGENRYEIVADAADALGGAARAARELGYVPRIIGLDVVGGAADAGRRWARRAMEASSQAGERVCLLAAGETTVEVRGAGRGGRNQEFCLGAAIELHGNRGVTLAALGTDGGDGVGPAAGAVADGDTVSRADRQGMNPTRFLAENDSYTFFAALSDGLVTGPTRTNVMDIHIALIEPQYG